MIIKNSQFEKNSANETASVYYWDFKPIKAQRNTYLDNQCKSLINLEFFEPDFLCLIVPKT